MTVRSRFHRRWIAPALGAALLSAGAIASAQTGTQPPATTPQPPAAGDQPPSLQQPSTGGTTAEALGLGQQQTASPAAAALGGNLGADTSARAPTGGIDATGSSVALAGGSAAPVLAAPDLGELLSKSVAASGVEIQRRNAIASDPRIRGYRVGQVVTLGDGALFFPARQDLDTAIAKFDPGSVRDIVIIKGPYGVQYGPGFAFLDIFTLDSPRYNCFEAHGRTSLGYQTNGDRWNGLQSIFAGDQNWGFRATYNILSGNDYRAGDGQDIAGSYNSQNVNFALGLDLSPNSRLEFKGLRVHQHDLEYPGLYFDIAKLDTEAYSLRYTLDKQQYFDRLSLDVWYNTTVSDGNTQQGAKQAFVQRLLDVSFNPPFGNGPLQFVDFSTTHFSNRSYGYRLALDWGKPDDIVVTAGSDLNMVGQTLVENIRFQQVAGPPLANPPPPNNIYTQNQGIPNSSQVNPGLFLEVATPLTDRMKVRTGGRLDYVHSISDPRLIFGNIDLFGTPGTPGQPVDRFVLDPIIYSSDPTNGNLVRDFPLFAAYMSSEYKIDDYLTGLLAVGYAERAPTLTELYASGPFIGVLQQGTSRLIGDPSLDKERLIQFDAGIKGDYEYFRGGATAFFAFVHDYITFDMNKRGLGITQVVFTNTDRATLAGGELFAQVDLNAWITPFATASYVQGIDQTHRDNRRAANLASSRRQDPATGQFADSTEYLPQIPPLELRSGFRIHPPTKNAKWQIEFMARSVMGQYNIARSLDEIPTPGFTVFDIRTYWQINDSWLVTAGVENFNDKLYREHLDPVSGNLLGVDPLFRPGTNFYFGSQFTY